MKNPEKFLNRVVNFKPIEEGAANSPEKKPVVDAQLITEFQKAISQFNEGLVGGKKEEDLYQMPNSEMDAKLYKFTRPQQFSHQPVSEAQVDPLSAAAARQEHPLRPASQQRAHLRGLQPAESLRRQASPVRQPTPQA